MFSIRSVRRLAGVVFALTTSAPVVAQVPAYAARPLTHEQVTGDIALVRRALE